MDGGRNISLKGQCVSCGRAPSWPHYSVCPYCGERVRMPAWWRIMRVGVPLVCVVAVVGLIPLTLPDLAEARDTVAPLQKTKAFLLAAVLVILLMPCRDSDLIVSSRAEIIRAQLKTLAGCLFVGTFAFAANFCMAFARIAGWGTYLLYTVATLCVCALPFLYRLPLGRVIAAVFLLVYILLPLHTRNFF